MASGINTVKKGDNFEDRSLQIVRQLLKDSQISHLPEQIKIYTKKDKGYYSSMRKKKIYFDLTIEIWPPGAERYALVYFIECKNCDNSVPVDDIEEFHKKIEQVSGAHAKGIVIANAPLQEGAYNYAESAGMMVIQGESSEDYKIILHKTNKKFDGKRIPLLKGILNDDLFDPGITLIESIVDEKILEAFQNIISDTHISYNLDKLSKHDIQGEANKDLNEIDPLILSQGNTLNPDKLKFYLNKKHRIKIDTYNKPSDLLGYCDIQNAVIGLNENIVGSSRELFILAHEFGHFRLHQKLKIGQKVYDNFRDSQYSFKTGKHDLVNPKNWIEWQANCFASSLVLPKIPFQVRLVWCQQRLHLPEGAIFIDDQYQNRKEFNELIKKMAYIFSTSKTSIIHRLNEFNLINDQSRLKSIRQIIQEYRDDLLI